MPCFGLCTFYFAVHSSVVAKAILGEKHFVAKAISFPYLALEDCQRGIRCAPTARLACKVRSGTISENAISAEMALRSSLAAQTQLMAMSSPEDDDTLRQPAPTPLPAHASIQPV